MDELPVFWALPGHSRPSSRVKNARPPRCAITPRGPSSCMLITDLPPNSTPRGAVTVRTDLVRVSRGQLQHEQRKSFAASYAHC